jgi:hypothetical protein
MAVSPAELIEQLAPRSERRVVAGLLAFAVALRIALLFVGYVQTEISRGNPGKNDVQPTREAFSETIARLDFADPGWYLQIAQDGYARRPFTTERHENWGFFPGWPLMMRMGAPFLGGAAQAARILANLASLAALVLLFRLLRLDYSVGVSTVATAALCASPYGYHLMRPGAEGAFLLFTVASLLAARRGRQVLAGTMGAMAVLVRPPGLFLFPALLVLVANEAKGDAPSWPWSKIARRAVPLLLIPAALAGYMLYMRSITGNAFAYFDMQRANWGQRAQFPLLALARWVRHPFVTSIWGWDLTLLSALAGIAVLVLVGVGVWRQRQGALHMRPEYWLYLGLNLVMIFSRDYLSGVGRYLLPVFPLFLLLALVLARRPATLLAIGAVSIVLQTFLFTNLLSYQTWAG